MVFILLFDKVSLIKCPEAEKFIELWIVFVWSLSLVWFFEILMSDSLRAKKSNITDLLPACNLSLHKHIH